MDLKKPEGTVREKLARMDWMSVASSSPLYVTDLSVTSGNFLVIASTTSVAIALTWGGIQFAWGSARVLVPLIVGLLGLCGFLVYEAVYAAHPLVRVVKVSSESV